MENNYYCNLCGRPFVRNDKIITLMVGNFLDHPKYTDSLNNALTVGECCRKMIHLAVSDKSNISD